MPEATPAAARVYFRDVKPYETPTSLADLAGPPGGVVELPHAVFWAPGGGRIDLDESGGLAMAYQAVIGEGTATDQVRVLNRDRLREAWPELMLPRRARELWEDRFPELRRTAVA
ncbi:transcriptional regulator [Cellulomonas cellasea]|uniref:Uncharacterized protein n=1 Tax=Cellulomonas cellasea TaxID=43670 RepID=A0A7W4UJZ9_9CELL|nr:transcriptional regulator [Cellulomonas cellasea]MBB2925544.1 hypothetical protein [Cellulomonas cellasea]